jgi:hypothetical protein
MKLDEADFTPVYRECIIGIKLDLSFLASTWFLLEQMESELNHIATASQNHPTSGGDFVCFFSLLGIKIIKFPLLLLQTFSGFAFLPAAFFEIDGEGKMGLPEVQRYNFLSLAVLARPFTRALYVLFLGSTKYV